MIDHRLTQADISILKSLIGTKLLCFKSEEIDSWNRIFGNISLVTNKMEIEIRNELTPTEYFEGEDVEDVSRFVIKQISDERPFELMIASDIAKTSVNETITDLVIVTDDISVKDSHGNSIYEISTAEAIIIKTGSSRKVRGLRRIGSDEVFFSNGSLPYPTGATPNGTNGTYRTYNHYRTYGLRTDSVPRRLWKPHSKRIKAFIAF